MKVVTFYGGTYATLSVVACYYSLTHSLTHSLTSLSEQLLYEFVKVSLQFHYVQPIVPSVL